MHLRFPLPTRRGLLALAMILAAATVATAASSGGAATNKSSASKKLIIFTIPFACGAAGYGHDLCQGVTDAGRKLPGFIVKIKTGTNYGDVVAYNDLLQTSYGLHPAGIIAFVNGPSAQTPTLKTGCQLGIKVMLIDSPATGMGKCLSGFVGSDHYGMGVADGKWLIAHPPASGSKEVGVVTQPPGEYASTDARVKGFTTTVEAAGYTVVETVVVQDITSDQNVSLVTNMLTAHPKIGAIFSANGPMGDSTAAALKGNMSVVQLSLDGDTGWLQTLQNGGLVGANTVQAPHAEGRLAITYMAKAIQGAKIPKLTHTPALVVDKTNVAKYLTTGGPR